MTQVGRVRINQSLCTESHDFRLEVGAEYIRVADGARASGLVAGGGQLLNGIESIIGKRATKWSRIAFSLFHEPRGMFEFTTARTDHKV